jgi:hypothetical protein
MNASDEEQRSTGTAGFWVIAAGALTGAVAAYALRTPRGRRAFEDVVVILDDFASGCERFSEACTRARIAASDGWSAVSGAAITPRSTGTR